MRLICPNCAAQYEVDEAVIPENGRDVQCSNCGHTWWQERYAQAAAHPPEGEAGAAESPVEPAPGPAAAAAAALAAAASGAAEAPRASWPDEDMPASADAAPPSAPQAGAWPEAPDEHPAPAQGDAPTWPEASPDELIGTAAPVPAAAAAHDTAPPADAPAEDEAAPERPVPGRTPRSLDEAVLDVLRQEAARESDARQRETQNSAVRDAAPVADPAARERIAAMAAEAGEDDSGRPERRLRRSKLPDVDEITSTLASQPAATGGDGRAVAAPAAAEGRAGFRAGFTLMIAIAILIGALYSYADRIVASAPATAPAMQAFVRTVDAGRAWLDRAALNATQAITSLSDGN